MVNSTSATNTFLQMFIIGKNAHTMCGVLYVVYPDANCHTAEFFAKNKRPNKQLSRLAA